MKVAGNRMPKIKFPLVSSNKHCYPSEPRCAWCKKNKVCEPHTFIGLSGGAMLMNQKRTEGWPDSRMDGFLDIYVHGAHWGGAGKYQDRSEHIFIAKDVKGGQFDLYFCSTKCLRAFLNYTVDELERKLKRKAR